MNIMEASNILLIGTHGCLDLRSPWLLHISLKEKFRVLDPTQSHGRAALIVLAACLGGLSRATTSWVFCMPFSNLDVLARIGTL